MDPARRTSRSADAERAVERLSEDEALRGDLTDDGFGPLLSLVANLVVARAHLFTATDDLYLAARRLLAGCVEAAEHGSPSALLDAATPPLVTPAERRELAALRSLPDSPDAAAVALAQTLARATNLELNLELEG